MYMNTYNSFRWKDSVEIVLLPSGSALISTEVLFCKWADSKLRIVSVLVETFYSLFLRNCRSDILGIEFKRNQVGTSVFEINAGHSLYSFVVYLNCISLLLLFFFVWRRQLPTTSGLTVLYSCLRNEIISLREAVRYYYNVNLYMF